MSKLTSSGPSTTGSDSEVEALRARIHDLEAALGQKDKTLAVTFRLTPALSNILGLLLALPNVNAEMVRQRLEIVTDAKVAMHRLRKHMKQFGVKIESRRNVGYWLENDTKEHIRAMLAGAPLEAPAEADLGIVEAEEPQAAA